MRTSIVYLRPLTVAYIRRTGPYREAARAAWAEMFAVVDLAGVRHLAGTGYGLLHDNPRTVDPAARRYDACIALTPELSPHCERLGSQVLPGGPYLRRCYKGDPTGLGDALRDLYASEQLSHDLRLDPRRPALEIYPSDPGQLDPPVVKVELCVPVAT